MRLLHWNVQWCRGMDGVVDPLRIARVASEIADPDVICFQEVAVNFPDLAGSDGEDQVASLQRAFPGHSAVFGAAVDVPAGASGRRQFGNMLLSRYPVLQIFRHTLPWPPDPGRPSMPRIAVEVAVRTPFGPLRVMTTHLEYYSSRQRGAQVERLRELHAEAYAHARTPPSDRYRSGPFEPFNRPAQAILTADFNMQPDDPAFARIEAPFDDGTPRLLDAWKHAHPNVEHPPTFCLYDKKHSNAPYPCDFVFLTEDLLPRLRSVRVDVETQASDHQPVIIELA